MKGCLVCEKKLAVNELRVCEDCLKKVREMVLEVVRKEGRAC